jgi:hypothetical protein
VVSSQFELFRTVLEEAIRKITLTVKWKAGRVDRQLVVDLYITDPTAVTRRAQSMGINTAASTAGSGTGTGSGSDAGSNSGSGSGSSSRRGSGGNIR